MKTIPAINCSDLECVRNRFTEIKKFLVPNGWVQIDVADGRFTFNKSWNNPDQLKDILAANSDFSPNLEIDLMVEDPEEVVEDWLRVGIGRVIVHIETMKNFEFISGVCDKYGTEVMLSNSPEAPVEEFSSYFERCSSYQVLAVHPGPSGQKFLPLTMDKVRSIRGAIPGAIIEVDGGINLETAKLCKEAGATMVASTSFIFSSINPHEAYHNLLSI